MTTRPPAVASNDRVAAAFMLAHLVLQLGSGLVGAAIFMGLGGLMSVLGAAEEAFELVAFGGVFGGIGALLGIFLLAQAIPAAVAAWGLWRGSAWRQIAAIVASLLAITHVPVGTAFAIGTLYFVYQSHKAGQAA